MARKTFEQPSKLKPRDISPLYELVGDDALDYALVIGSFHFINRIADLLDVPPEALPKPLRRFEFLRRLAVRAGSVLMGKMDLANREYRISYEAAVENIKPLLQAADSQTAEAELRTLRARPKWIEILQLALEYQSAHSILDSETINKINRTVEESLPHSIEDIEGFHAQPEDPIAAFAFIGTRYAHRMTEDLIKKIRKMGYDDGGILDLAVAVAEANQWARSHRLLGLKAELYYL